VVFYLLGADEIHTRYHAVAYDGVRDRIDRNCR
jgi:hypothetical protein